MSMNTNGWKCPQSTNGKNGKNVGGSWRITKWSMPLWSYHYAAKILKCDWLIAWGSAPLSFMFVWNPLKFTYSDNVMTIKDIYQKLLGDW